MAVHNTFSLNWIFLSGLETSGKTEMNGRKTSRNFIPIFDDYLARFRGLQEYFSREPVDSVRIQ